MKTVLRNIRGRAGWAVVAAGALGIAIPIEAQNYPYLAPTDPAQQATEVVDAVNPRQAESGPLPMTPSARTPAVAQEEPPRVEPTRVVPPLKKPARPVAYQTKWRRWEGAESASPARKKPSNAPPNPSSAPTGTLWLDTPPEPGQALAPVTSLLPAPTPEPDSYITGGMIWLDLASEPPAPLGPGSSQVLPTAEPDSYVTGGMMWLDLPAEPPVAPRAPVSQAGQAGTVPEPPRLSGEWRPAVASVVPPLPQPPAAPIVPPPAPVVPSPHTTTTTSVVSANLSTKPTPLLLPVDSMKELRAAKSDPENTGSHPTRVSPTKADVSASSPPKLPVIETTSSFRAGTLLPDIPAKSALPAAAPQKLTEQQTSGSDPVMTKLQYAAVPVPKPAPELSQGSVMLDAPIKHGSPYMPVGHRKEAPAKHEKAPDPGAAHVSSGIVLVDEPATPPTAIVERAKPPVAAAESKPAEMPAGSGHVSSGIMLVDLPAKPPAAAVELPKRSVPVIQPAKPTIPPAPPPKPAIAAVEPAMPPVTPAAVSSHKKPSGGVADSYVSTGVVILDSTEKVVETKAKPALSALQNRFQQRVAAVCGKPVKDVEVTARAEKSLHIRVKAGTTQEAEALSGKVLQLPELEPFEVSLDVLVNP